MNDAVEVGTALQTLREMLIDRGIDEADLVNLDGFNVKKQMSQKFVIDVTGPVRIKIVFNLGAKLRQKNNDEYFTKSADEVVDYFILVLSAKLTLADMKKIAELSDGQQYQVFFLSELQFNISHHSFVPKHELITDEAEIAALVTANQIKVKTQFPLIMKTDPMAKYLFAKTGNLIRITRNSQTSGVHIIYRCVV